MNFLEAMLHEGVPEHMSKSVLSLLAPVGVGNKHAEVLETYQRHLRSGSPTQATRPKWSDIHAALDAAQIALLANPQPGAAALLSQKANGLSNGCDTWQPGAVVGEEELRSLRQLDNRITMDADGMTDLGAQCIASQPALQQVLRILTNTDKGAV